MKSKTTLAVSGRRLLGAAGAVSAMIVCMRHAIANVDNDNKIPPTPPQMQDVKTPANSPSTKPAAPAPQRVNTRANTSAPTKLPAPRVEAPHTQIQRVYYDAHPDGTVWALGTSYKASFDKDGATYIPFLGSCAPTNYPVRFSLESVTVGGQPIGFDSLATAVHDGERVVYDRGGVVESYDLSLESMEQLFTFTSLPSGGDLVVRMNVGTTLDAFETSQGFSWSNVLGGVKYGRATLVDAVGNRTTVASHLEAGAIEIEAPASVLADATFPVVIDPVIGSFTVDNSTNDDLNPDIAFDAANGVYNVCWERVFSGTDHDCYSQLQTSTGATVAGSLVTIDFTGDSWVRPRTAENVISQQFLVAAEVTPFGGGNRVIKGVTRQANGNGSSSQFQISDPTVTSDQFDVSVGGDPNPFAPTYYCVVWDRIFSSSDQDIFARLVDPTTSGTFGSLILVDNSSATIDENPSVSKSDGYQPATGQDWSIVWSRQFSPSDHDIRGAQIHWDGTITTASFSIDFSTSDDTLPAVSSVVDGTGTNRDYLVTYQRFFGPDNDIEGVVLNAATAVTSVTDLSVLEGVAIFQDQVEPAADSDGAHFGVTYSEQFSSSTTDYDVYISSFSYGGGSIQNMDPHENLAISGDPELVPRVVARHSGGAPGSCYGVVWSDTFGPNDHDVYGNQYCPTLVTSYCGNGTGFLTSCPCSNPGLTGRGCNNSINTGGALLTSSGTSSLSADSLHFSQSGELNSALSVFIQGNHVIMNGLAFGDGVRCVGGALKRLYKHNASSGTVQAPVGADPSVHSASAAHGDPISAGTERYYQVYYRDPNLTFCSPGFNVGNALAVAWTL